MYDVYFWKARYSNDSEDTLIIGANSKTEAREFVEDVIKNFGHTVDEVYVLEKISKVKAVELGILEVY